jgi:hypothetical protein
MSQLSLFPECYQCHHLILFPFFGWRNGGTVIHFVKSIQSSIWYQILSPLDLRLWLETRTIKFHYRKWYSALFLDTNDCSQRLIKKGLKGLESRRNVPFLWSFTGCCDFCYFVVKNRKTTQTCAWNVRASMKAWMCSTAAWRRTALCVSTLRMRYVTLVTKWPPFSALHSHLRWNQIVQLTCHGNTSTQTYSTSCYPTDFALTLNLRLKLTEIWISDIVYKGGLS